MHLAHPIGRGWLAVQQVQQVPADRIVVGLDLDAPAPAAEVVPVEQHRAERRHQPVGDVFCAGEGMVVLFRLHGAERRHPGAHHVHRVRRGRHGFERRPDRCRQPAQPLELRLVRRELRRGRQFLVNEQVGDFLELGLIGEIENVVAPVMQIVAAAADRAQRGVAGRNSGERNRLLGPRCRCALAHLVFSLANSWSSLRS